MSLRVDAQAVRGRVSRRQAENFADRDADIAYDRRAAYAQQAGAAPTPAVPAAAAPAAAAAGTSDMLDQLAKLGELRDNGVLTEDEFAVQKAKILAAG